MTTAGNATKLVRGTARRADSSAQGIAAVRVDDDAARLIVGLRSPIERHGTGHSGTLTYTLTGGERIFPVIRSVAAFDATTVILQLDRIGDFSTYTLTLSGADVDPFFARASVRFRLGCEETTDPEAPPPAEGTPAIPVPIDYLAKDYAGFRQALLDFAAARYPDWRERSEADFSMALVELFSWAADMLSYMQDRVGNEAFLETASQRRSVAAHLALIGYAIDQGASASTWLQFTVTRDIAIVNDDVLAVANQPLTPNDTVVIFEIAGPARFTPEQNEIRLYDWGYAGCVLPADALEATFAGHFAQLSADGYLIFHDRNGGARDVVQIAGEPTFRSINGINCTTVTWSPKTPLGSPYALDTTYVSANIALATHGETHADVVVRKLDAAERRQLERDRTIRLPGALPARQRLALGVGPLTFIERRVAATTSTTQRVARSMSTLTLRVEGDPEPWSETVSLLECGPADRVFQLEIDDDGDATIVFGDGTCGRRPADSANVSATLRIGGGSIGNVAAGTLVVLRSDRWSPAIDSVTNPFAAAGGRAPESREAARRFATAAFETPVALIGSDDYAAATAAVVNAAGSPLVDIVRADFAWTGSWTTAQVVARPASGLPTQQWMDTLKDALETRRLAGFDIEVVAAAMFPIHLALIVTARPGSDANQLRAALESAFGTGPDGLFRPGAFDFGAPVNVSAIEATAMAVDGIATVRIAVLAALHSPRPRADTLASIRRGFLPVPGSRIVQLDNDRNAPDRGRLTVEVAA